MSLLAAGLEPFASWSGPGDADPFDALRAHLARRQTPPHPRWPFTGGVIGWFGYGCRTLLEDLPERHPRESALPDVYLAACPVFAAIDEASGESVVGWLDDPADPGRSGAARALAGELRVRLEDPALAPGPPPERPFRPEQLRWPRREDHLWRVTRALEHIARGDVYQVNLAQRWELPRPADLVGAYRRLRSVNPPAFGGFLAAGGEALLSVSPEEFLHVDHRVVTTRPIKGTARRDPDPRTDAALVQALAASPKDRAELAMIVDILRNDLSRVCQPGSVRVPRPLVVESHPTVHHLVADVTGCLEAGRDLVDLLRATLPGGSVTGAPRIRAMEVIDDLESGRRGPYCGAFGTIGYDGRMDLNILIRTAFTAGDRLFFHGGGGIVADSDPGAEHEEAVHKVRGLIDALVAAPGSGR